LQSIAEATRGRSAGMAKGVLRFFFDICYENECGRRRRFSPCERTN